MLLGCIVYQLLLGKTLLKVGIAIGLGFAANLIIFSQDNALETMLSLLAIW